MKNLATQINEVYFYEGSYQFKSDKTPLNIHSDYIQMVLAKQHEYRTPDPDSPLWADVFEGGVHTHRYLFSYTNGLTDIKS